MGRDRIQLEGMVFHGFHGVNPAERDTGQPFVVDLDVYRDLRPAGITDDLQDTVSYSALYRLVKGVVEGPPRDLLESVAEAIAGRVLDEYDVDSVRVRVKKPEAPIRGATLAGAAVEIFRERAR